MISPEQIEDMQKRTDSSLPRKVAWMSCGAASFAACMLSLLDNMEQVTPNPFVIAYIHLKDEHEDNKIFIEDCERFFHLPVTILQSEKYNGSVDEVIEKTKYMSGVYGARCTKELKKQVRLDWQEFSDIHIFGMDVNEGSRIDQLLDNEADLSIETPLIDKRWAKEDCFALLELLGIAMPAMYLLGFHNNNCIGCLKAGGAGYWNLVRKYFPEIFQKRANQERMCGVALVKMSANVFATEHPDYFIEMLSDKQYKVKIDTKGQIRIPLRFLPPDAGRHEPAYVPNCGFFCETE